MEKSGDAVLLLRTPIGYRHVCSLSHTLAGDLQTAFNSRENATAVQCFRISVQ